MATLTADDVQEALTNVIDPELGLDFVAQGRPQRSGREIAVAIAIATRLRSSAPSRH